MIKINMEHVDKRAAYGLLTSSVVPRPIALVTTISEDGIVNIAPFSYFNVVTASPARLSIVIGKKMGSLKDTARNVFNNRKFVVHVVTESNLVDANMSAAKLPSNQSELSVTDFTVEHSDTFEVPHLKDNPLYFECVLDQYVSFEDSDMIIGKVSNMYVLEQLLIDGKVDVKALNPIGRLSGNSYAKLGDFITLKRPE